MLGVKMPAVRAWARSLSDRERTAFLADLPHRYVEENQAHVVLIGEMADFDQARQALLDFAPFADNWAVTDVLKSKAFGQDSRTEQLALELLSHDNPYGIRMGMLVLMRYFLKTDPHLPEVLACDRSHDTLSMLTAWYLAELAVTDPAVVLEHVNELDWLSAKRLGQKVRDSRRIPADVKNQVTAAVNEVKARCKGISRT